MGRGESDVSDEIKGGAAAGTACFGIDGARVVATGRFEARTVGVGETEEAKVAKCDAVPEGCAGTLGTSCLAKVMAMLEEDARDLAPVSAGTGDSSGGLTALAVGRRASMALLKLGAGSGA